MHPDVPADGARRRVTDVVGSEDRVHQSPRAAPHGGHHAHQRVAERADTADVFAKVPGHRFLVGSGQGGAVHGDQAQALVEGAGLAVVGHGAGQDREQVAQRSASQPAPGTGQRRGARVGHGHAAQSRRGLGPYRLVGGSLEEGVGQPEVHHDARREQPQPLLPGTSVLQDRVDQLGVDDLGQLAQMDRRVHVQGCRAGPYADRILRQRDLRDTRNGLDTMRTTALLTGRTHP